MKLLPALGRRLLYTLPVVWLVVSLVFLLIHLVPGDPVAQMLGEGATATDLDVGAHLRRVGRLPLDLGGPTGPATEEPVPLDVAVATVVTIAQVRAGGAELPPDVGHGISMDSICRWVSNTFATGTGFFMAIWGTRCG